MASSRRCAWPKKSVVYSSSSAGRKWDRTTYPCKIDDPWIWSHVRPEIYNGWLEDAGSGKPFLDADGSLDMKWDLADSLGLFEEIAAKHKQLAHASGGFPIPLPGWSFEKDPITPHALSGCNMGNSEKDGVVDHKGEVFGHPGLYVVDGAIIARALGVNRTIGALAERIAALMPPCREA